VSGTVKTVLIVGGAALGVALILRATSSPATAAIRAQQPGASSLQGLIGLASAAKGLFGSASPNTPTVAAPPITYSVIPAGSGGEYIVPSTASSYGPATGTGGYGIAGLDYPIQGSVSGVG